MNEREILEKYTNTKKQPTLLPYLDDIKFLLDNNASQQSILEYLKEEQDINVSKSTLSVFIKKQIKKMPFTPEEQESNASETKTEPTKLKRSIFDDD